MRHLMSELRPRRRESAARRDRRRLLRSPWLRRAAGLGVAALVLTAAALAVRAPGPAAWLAEQALAGRAALTQATIAAGFAVREVYVSGRHETAAEDLVAALGVRVGDPVLLLDLAWRRAGIEALPWVEHAAIERRLPDVIVVRLIERRALALWQHDGAVTLIDRAGSPIEGVDPRRFAHLPLVVGAGAPARAAELVAVLGTEPLLATRVASAVLVGGRRWELRFDNGVAAALPARGWAEAWARLAAIERDHRLLGRGLARIDLRLPDRVVIRLTDEGRALREQVIEDAKGENT